MPGPAPEHRPVAPGAMSPTSRRLGLGFWVLPGDLGHPLFTWDVVKNTDPYSDLVPCAAF